MSNFNEIINKKMSPEVSLLILLPLKSHEQSKTKDNTLNNKQTK